MKMIADFKRIMSSKRERLLFFALALGGGLLILADKTIFHGQLMSTLLVLEGIFLIVFLAAIAVIAGVEVIKALFHVAAGLSLVIYLAQSYCDAAGHTTTSDGALKSLLLLSFGYIVFDFVRILYKALINYWKSMSSIEGTWEKYLTFAILFLFVGLFIWAVFEVMRPIVLDLCIYKIAEIL